MNVLKDSNLKKNVVIMFLLLIFELIMTIFNFYNDSNQDTREIVLIHFVCLFVFSLITFRFESVLEKSYIVVLPSLLFVMYTIFESEKTLIDLMLFTLALIIGTFYNSYIVNWLMFLTVSIIFCANATPKIMDANFAQTDLFYYVLIFLSVTVTANINLSNHLEREELLRRSKMGFKDDDEYE